MVESEPVRRNTMAGGKRKLVHDSDDAQELAVAIENGEIPSHYTAGSSLSIRLAVYTTRSVSEFLNNLRRRSASSAGKDYSLNLTTLF